MTDEELAAIKARHEWDAERLHLLLSGKAHLEAHADRAALLLELRRVRAENARFRKALKESNDD